jgi:hypothetical protein
MKSWLFPCNLSKYDILGSFLKNGFVDYGTALSVSEGDEVYIYAGAPYSAIFLKCMVRTVLKYEETINDSEFYIEVSNNSKPRPKYVRLVPIANYLNKIDILNSTKLKENGVKGFAYQSELANETTEYINSI